MAKRAKSAGRPQMTTAEKEARKVALKNESKTEKFTRLGLPRMTKALNAIRQIGNLSGPGYEYGEEQVAKMRAALGEAMTETFARFNRAGAKEKTTFTF